MKRILLIIFALISLNAFSQLQVKEGSFKYIPNGVIEDKAEYVDGNEMPMALIKISTENIPEQERLRLVFTGNRETQILKRPKTGQMWIYISAEAATFIDIKHPDYGTHKYYIPERLCDYCVYEMVLQYVNSQPELGFLAVSSEPTDADIYIDGTHYGKTNNVITDLVVGSHQLKLEKEGYVTVSKTIVTTKGETLKLNETLQAVSNKADKKQQVSSVTKETFKVKGVSFVMVKVEGGTFQMGATQEQGRAPYHSGEGLIHSVTLSDYCIGETEVTQELWQAVMGTNPSRHKGAQKPVNEVSWDDCQGFIAELNKLTGKNFRLPTEAEWEYAARGGNMSKGFKYSGSNKIRKVAWFHGNAERFGCRVYGVQNVKTKLPNELGIYDMSGNVSEWCYDIPGEYVCNPQTNPQGALYGNYRAYRGGGWSDFKWHCLASFRECGRPNYGSYDRGFRLCISSITEPINIKEGAVQSGGDGSMKLAFKQEHNGYEYVDLGLSVKWATCNVGASSPEDYGNYYAWGEITTKTNYSSDNCKTSGKQMSNISGNAQYDAARANWGGSWRMPTKSEMRELIDKCTWTWTTQNGVNGYKVTSKTNGNYIFLPAAGCRYGSSLSLAGSFGYYWSSTPNASDSYGAYGLRFYSSSQSMDYNYRDYGRSVRPVIE